MKKMPAHIVACLMIKAVLARSEKIESETEKYIKYTNQKNRK